MKFTLLVCGLFGCHNYAFFERLNDCQRIAEQLHQSTPTLAYACVERAPNWFERLLQ